MSALTPKQAELLTFIKEYQFLRGCSPSFEEMKDALDLKSKSGIHRLINALVERGFLRRIPNRARAIEVVENPHITVPPPRQVYTLRSYSTSVLLRELDRRGFNVPLSRVAS